MTLDSSSKLLRWFRETETQELRFKENNFGELYTLEGLHKLTIRQHSELNVELWKNTINPTSLAPNDPEFKRIEKLQRHITLVAHGGLEYDDGTVTNRQPI